MSMRRGRTALSLRRALYILPAWVISIIWMWSWWFTVAQERYLPLFIPLSLALFYEFAILPSVFLYFVFKAEFPIKRIAPKDKKVAVISLCVPSSESLDIVEKQLKAMSEIIYPHDSWILDEGNNNEVKVLARKYGVKHFSRKGIRAYNQAIPPFQKKTKAGNVNAWLNHVKRRRYEYFVQLDIDHIPKPNYLNKTLGYFRDLKVAWVQAPSVYKNLDHWTARGAAEQELVLQGPLQMGFYGHCDTPFIIGSHCTYRMSAIREIGGFQPTRAEDHLDTVYLAHSGYTGVFLPDIIAEGDGPETLNTYLAQQFAWAYSMFQVLLGHTPKLLKDMSWKRRFQFLFAQTWYPLWSLSYLVMFICPIIALWLKREVVTVDPHEMLIHFAPVFVGGFIVWWTARPIMQPRNLLLSWRGMILHAVRWPIIVRAILTVIFKIKKPYMITPKGKYAHIAPTMKTYQPFLLLGMLSALSVLITSVFNHGVVPQAQIIFAITNATFMLTICTVDIGLRLRQLKPKLSDFKQYWLKPVGATAALAMIVVVSIIMPPYTANHTRAFAQTSDYSLNKSVVIPVNNNMSKNELVEQIGLVEPHKNKTTLPALGMYNSTLDLPKTKQRYIQHSFTDWRDDHYFALVLAKTLQSDNVPLITIEPRGESDGAKLLIDIQAGVYDKRLDNLAEAITASKSPIYIRFAHEMELKKLYPWSDQNPSQYIAAFRHVAARLRAGNTKRVYMVWSPAGNWGSEAYYPGDDYVDVVGTTVLYDEYWYGSYWLPSFKSLAQSRQWLQSFGKPVWIVEFGAGNANKSNQKILIDQAMKNFTGLGYKSLIYLNLIDANIEGPDYRLDSINEFGSLFIEDPVPTNINSPNDTFDVPSKPCLQSQYDYSYLDRIIQNSSKQKSNDLCSVIPSLGTTRN